MIETTDTVETLEILKNTHFVRLPRGSFWMGTDDDKARDREKPRHEVTIDYDI
ncbi:MAG: hypothetical protein Q9M36_04410 [Sulfurovum sp.]|nr:hypothetical protein [Sulfurovum sp.]